MYKLVRWILFLFNSDKIHHITIKFLRGLKRFRIFTPLFRLLYNYRDPLLEKEIFGVKFKNPVGLASGFDYNGDCYNLLSDFGFGFIELGTITPQPQQREDKHSILFFPKNETVISKREYQNLGVKHTVNYLKKTKPNCVIGVNIASNLTTTQLANILKDYELAFEYLYDFVDYFAINVEDYESPDKKGISSLSEFSELLDSLLTIRNMYDEYRPILLKVSPDLSEQQLDEVIDTALVSGLDGIIATNSTNKISDYIAHDSKVAQKAQGGRLSGDKLFDHSLLVVKYINGRTKGQLPIIACGGITTPARAKMMLDAGASLIQINTGFIYKGPRLVRNINRYIAKDLRVTSNR